MKTNFKYFPKKYIKFLIYLQKKSMQMTNNDILKKLRVALQLRNDQIVEILQLVDFRASRAEIDNLFRAEDHEKYVLCGDQILRNFLNGLIIYKRGTKENPVPVENSKDSFVTRNDKVFVKPEFKKPEFKKPIGEKKPFKKEFKSNKPPEIVEKVKFNNGKPKKKD